MATTTRKMAISWGASATLGVTVLAADGSTLIARSTSGIVAQGNGQYLASIPNWDLTWGAWVIVDDGTSTAAGTDGDWFEQLAPTVNGELIQTTSDGHVEATDEMGGSLATPLANLDATVSSRLPTSSYTAPPTAAAIAAATRDVNNATPSDGSLGAAVNSAQSAAAAAPTVAQIAAGLAASTLVVLSAVGGNAITIARGCAYSVTYGNPLDFPRPAGSLWPSDFTGWTLWLEVAKTPRNTEAGGPWAKWAMTIVTASGDDQQIRLTLASTQTAALAVGHAGYRFRIKGTPPDAGVDVVELLLGAMTVTA